MRGFHGVIQIRNIGHSACPSGRLGLKILVVMEQREGGATETNRLIFSGTHTDYTCKEMGVEVRGWGGGLGTYSNYLMFKEVHKQSRK